LKGFLTSAMDPEMGFYRFLLAKFYPAGILEVDEMSAISRQVLLYGRIMSDGGFWNLTTRFCWVILQQIPETRMRSAQLLTLGIELVAIVIAWQMTEVLSYDANIFLCIYGSGPSGSRDCWIVFQSANPKAAVSFSNDCRWFSYAGLFILKFHCPY